MWTSRAGLCCCLGRLCWGEEGGACLLLQGNKCTHGKTQVDERGWYDVRKRNVEKKRLHTNGGDGVKGKENTSMQRGMG